MKKKIIFISVINALFITIFFILLFINTSTISGVLSQNIYERWSGDKTVYTQLSLFLSNNDGIAINDIYMNRSKIEKKLSENSIAPNVVTLPNGTVLNSGKFWIDAYSASGGIISLSNNGKDAQANLIATGGEFFNFHPIDMVNGCFYSDDDIMLDRVIIDDVLAWQLFGSSDVNGMRVKINGYDFYIAGVTKSEAVNSSLLIENKKPLIYMSYETALKLNENLKITCYEACIPDPVKGIGKKIFEDSVPSSENCIIIENKARFSIKNILKIISEYDISRIRTNEIALPYWENEARIIENKSAKLVLSMIIFLIVPIFTLIFLFYLLIKNRKKLTSLLVKKIIGAFFILKNSYKAKISKKTA